MVRRILQFLLSAVGVLLLLMVAAAGFLYYVAVSDQNRVPELVNKYFQQISGGSVLFSHYHIGFLDPSSGIISVVLEDVTLHDSAYVQHKQELVQLEKLSLTLDPLKLLRKEIEINKVLLENGHVNLIRSADGYFNVDFLTKIKKPAVDSTKSGGKFSLDKVRLKGVEILLRDSLRDKFHGVLLRNVKVNLENRDTAIAIHTTGDWLFRGITFKPANGSFLTNKEANVDLVLDFLPGEHRLAIRPSRLIIDGNNYDLTGQLLLGKPSNLQLHIFVPSLTLAEGRPLLADNLQKVLQKFEVDGPVRVDVVVAGDMYPGRPLPADVTIQAEDVAIRVDSQEITEATFTTHFYNCDPAGPVNPRSGCLAFDGFSGKLFGKFPVTATVLMEDLSDPHVRVKAEVKAPLEALKDYLPPEQFDFRQGEAVIAVQLDRRAGQAFIPGIGNEHASLSGRVAIHNGRLNLRRNRLAINGLSAALRFDNRHVWLDTFGLNLNGDPIRLAGRIDRFFPFIFDHDRRLYARLSVWSPHLNIDHFLPKKPARKASSKAPPKDKRQSGRDSSLIQLPALADIVEKISNRLEADLSVRAGELSYRKFKATDVVLRSRLNASCSGLIPGGGTGPCLVVDTFSATLYDALRLNASFSISQPDDPVIAMDARVMTPLTALSPMVPADKLQFQDGTADVSFRYQGKLEKYFDVKRAVLNGSLEGNIHIAGASLDYTPKGYRLRDLDGTLRFDQNDLVIDSLDASVNDNVIEARGRIPEFIPLIFTGNRKLVAMLVISSPAIDFAKFSQASATPPAKAKKTKTRTTPVTKALEAGLKNLETELIVKAGEIHYRQFSGKNVYFRGHVHDDCHDNHNDQDKAGGACAHIDTLRARLFDNTPLEASLTAHHLDDPFFQADMRVDMPLRQLEEMFSPRDLTFEGGAIDIRIHYEGFFPDPSQVKTGPKDTPPPYVLRGKASLTDAALSYVPRGYHFSGLNGYCTFDSPHLYLDNLDGKINDNTFGLSGTFNDLLRFVIDPTRKVAATLTITSPELNFDRFTAPKTHAAAAAGDTTARHPTEITKVVKAALTNITVDLTTDLARLRYRDFVATSVQGNLTVKPDTVRFRDASMRVADGVFTLQGQLTGVQKNRPRIDIRTQMQHTNMPQILRAFNNFNLDGLTADNVQGILTADISFRAQADDSYTLDPNSINGYVDLKLENGALIDMPFLLNMQKSVFKNRDFGHVQFATLEQRFDIRNQTIHIKDFDIYSSVLVFGVEGQYGFGDSTANTNLLFQVPIGNLFRNDLDAEALQNLQDHPKRGLSVLLRGTEEEGKFKLKLVLSRKQGERE